MREAPTKTWHGNDVDATTIESQAGRMWTEISRPSTSVSASRTHLYNLVVFAGPRDRAQDVMRVLAALAVHHPSHAIVLVSDRSNPVTSVDAEVTVHCMGGPENGPSLCHEQIVVTGHGRAADHLNSVVVPLLNPELRTYLWWPGQPPFGHRTFHQLLALADQFVVDSADFQSPGDGLANLARMCRSKQGVNDFEWTRLTPWREIVAQFFDGANWAQYARAIRKITMQFATGDQERSAVAMLLVLGWMANRLGWEVESALDGVPADRQTMSVLAGERVIPIEVDFREAGTSMRGRLLRFEAVSQPKDEPPARFVIERALDNPHVTAKTIVHEGADFSRVVPLEGRHTDDLLAYELSLAGHDPVYDDAVHKASQLAGRELWLTP